MVFLPPVIDNDLEKTCAGCIEEEKEMEKEMEERVVALKRAIREGEVREVREERRERREMERGEEEEEGTKTRREMGEDVEQDHMASDGVSEAEEAGEEEVDNDVGELVPNGMRLEGLSLESECETSAAKATKVKANGDADAILHQED